MTVSMNLHDCAAHERLRAELARQVAEYERRNGPVQTTPTIKRSPDTRVDLVIRADVEDKRAAQKSPTADAVAAAQKAAAHAPRWR